jgi:hypothetical protein
MVDSEQILRHMVPAQHIVSAQRWQSRLAAGRRSRARKQLRVRVEAPVPHRIRLRISIQLARETITNPEDIEAP